MLALVVPMAGVLAAFTLGGRHAERAVLLALPAGLGVAAAIAVRVARSDDVLVYALGAWSPPLGVALRADGRRLIPAYLFEVKKPEESKGPWDYYKQIATIAAEDAAKPLETSDCPLLKK